MKQFSQNCWSGAEHELTARILYALVPLPMEKRSLGSVSFTKASGKLWPHNLPLIYHLLRSDSHCVDLGVIFLVMEIWQTSTSKKQLHMGTFLIKE